MRLNTATALSLTVMLTLAPTLTSNLYSIVYPNSAADGDTVNSFSDVCLYFVEFFSGNTEKYMSKVKDTAKQPFGRSFRTFTRLLVRLL